VNCRQVALQGRVLEIGKQSFGDDHAKLFIDGDEASVKGAIE
jgi:hypothetical protein